MAQPTTAFTYTSLEDMRARVYAGIRRKSTDPLAGLSQSSINEYIAKWDAYFVDYARWNFPGFKRQRQVNFKSGTTLGSAVSAGDAVAELTSNANAESGGGRISINGDLVDYTAKDTPNSGTSITTSTTAPFAIDVDHAAGLRVEFLIPVPSDFGIPGEMFYIYSGSVSSSKLTHVDWRMATHPLGQTYTHHDGYLLLPQNLSTQVFQLHYWKKGFKVIAGDDLQTPAKWDDIVKYAAMGECYIITKEFELASNMFKLAGVPNPIDPGESPNGLLQHAAGLDAEQTDSRDEVFLAELGSYHL